MLSYFLGIMVMTIYNQTYGTSTVVELMRRYGEMTELAMSMSFFNAIIATIKSVAAGFAVLTYLIDLSGKVTEKNFNIEQFFKATLRLIVCYMFIMNSDVIVGYLMELGSDAAGHISDSDAGYDFFKEGAHKTMLINGISKMKVVEILGYIVSSILPWVLSMIGEVVVQVIMVTRILEIVVMTSLSPFSISDIYREGTASPGIHYMKRMFALGLQVSVILMVNIATQAIIMNVVGAGAGQAMTDLLEMTDFSGSSTEALQDGTLVYTLDSLSTFLRTLTGGGHIFKVLGIMAARIGLIWGSLPLCEEIAGAR